MGRTTRARGAKAWVRTVGYHSVPETDRASFRRQLEHFARRYECLDEEGLATFAARPAGGRRGEVGARPGLVISFDDGLLDNYLVAAPLLEAAGLRGWFFVPTGLPGLPAAEQEAYCARGALRLPAERGARIAMSWDELRDLTRRGHVVGCHTESHRRMRGPLDEGLLERELVASKRAAEAALGSPVASFAWVGGETDTYDAEAEAAIARAGFRFAFTTKSSPFRPGDDPLRIHRTILEPGMPYGLFRLKLAGLSDLRHARGRAAAMARLGLPRGRSGEEASK